MPALRSSSHQRIELKFVVTFADVGAAVLPPRLLLWAAFCSKSKATSAAPRGHRELLKLTVGFQR